MSDNVPVASRPTERELDLELVKLVDWQVFATHLPGLERENIEQIQRNNHEVHLQKLELFGTWLRIQPDASWKDVVLALENARENTLAEAVKRKFKLAFDVQATCTSRTMRVCESHQIQHTSNEKVFLPIAVDEVQKTNDSTDHLKVEERKDEVIIETVDEIATQLVRLHKRFAQLETNIKGTLESVINKGQKTIKDIARYLRRHLEETELKLTDAKDIDDLFDKLESFYSFLDCELLEEIVNQFLEGKIQAEVEKYVTDVEAFKELTTLQELKDAIEQALLPTQSVTPSTCEVILKVSKRWKKEKMRCLNKLLEHIFSKKRYLLNHIKLEDGSLCIRFLVPKSQVEMLIALATKHMEFMYLLGVFEMMINNIPVLMEDENENFTFDSALLESSQSGNNEAVQFLLDLGVNVNYSNSEGKTALMLPSEAGHEEAVQTLVSAEANVDLQDSAGQTALILACEAGHEEVVQTLVSAGANVNLQDCVGLTALILASEAGHEEVVQTLVSAGANVNLQDCVGLTALILASKAGHEEVVQTLVSAGANVNLQDCVGLTALILASKAGHEEVVQTLVSAGANVNLQDSALETALMLASEGGHEEVVQTLVSAGANVNLQDCVGLTALILASEGGHEEVVQTLVSAGANVNLQDSALETALMLASRNVGIICCLLLANANLDIQRNDGNTALHIACYKGHNTVIELLLSYHASPVIKNTKDDTPFMASVRGNNADILKLMLDAIPSSHLSSGIVLACRLGHSAVFSLLVKQLECTPQVIDLFISCAEGDVGSVTQHIMELNIDPNTTLISGITSLMIASSCGHVEVIDTLIQMEADVNRIDIDNYSPLAYAIIGKKSLPTVQYLLEAGANPHVLLGGITILERAHMEEGQQDICDKLFKFSALDLQKRFKHLLDRIEEGFNVLIGKEKDILLHVSQFLEVFPEITESSKVHDSTTLFNRVRAYSDFLSYELLVVITIEFLKYNVEILEEFEEYLSVVQTFDELLKIEHFANVMAFLPQQEETTIPTTAYLVFKLNRQWSNKTLKNIRNLCSFLFSDNQRYLSHMTVDIVEKVPCIKFLIPNCTQIIEDLISEVAKKRELMYLLGVFEMMINNTAVLMEDEDKNFTFESAIQKADDNEAVQLLLDLSNVDRTHNESKPFPVASDPGHLSVDITSLLNNPNALDDETGYPQLILASETGMYQMVEILLKKGADPNIRNENGETALIQASENGHYKVVKILLKKGADPNIREEDGWTALLFASLNGHYPVVKILHQNGADPNIHDNNGWTALINAAQNGHQQVVELLLEKPVDPNVQNSKNGRTALIQASSNGHYQVVEILLKKGADPNIREEDGWTALLFASLNGHYPVVKILHQNGADPNIHDNNGWTALINAAQNSHQQVVELLLEKQVDPNVQNSKNGRTALIQASSNGHYQMVETLLKKGADPNIHDNDGRTALMVASQEGHSDIIEVLLRYNANPHYFVTITSNGVSLDSLACAAVSGNIECLNILLKHTKFSFKSLSMGLYFACHFGHVSIIRLFSNSLDIISDQTDLIISCAEGDLGSVVDQLMSGKITPDVQFIHGVTPLIISSSCGHTDIVEALITAGANVNKTDEFGWTALDYAEEAEQTKRDATKNILLQHGGIKGSDTESESHETTSEEQKLSTDTSQSTIKSSQDSLLIREKELNSKKRPFLIMKKLFKDTVKYRQSIFSSYQRFDNREYSTTTHIPIL